MARTPSNMLPLGTKAPNFNLIDVTNNTTASLDNLKGEVGTMIMFICNHCPFVKHVNHTLASMGHDYHGNQINFIAISSNDVINYPEDGPELMKSNATENNFNFPYLYDESQQVAKDYDAACTPDFYLFDSELKLIYRGQLDDSRPGNELECDGADLKNALDCLLEGKENNEIQKPSIGCNIKWK